MVKKKLEPSRQFLSAYFYPLNAQ